MHKIALSKSTTPDLAIAQIQGIERVHDDLFFSSIFLILLIKGAQNIKIENYMEQL